MELNDQTIKLNGARVLVKEIRNDDKLRSGIIISGRSKQNTYKGIVVATGDGALLADGTRIPVAVKKGDFVMYSSFSGSPIKVNEEDENVYLILNERDILCVIKE